MIPLRVTAAVIASDLPVSPLAVKRFVVRKRIGFGLMVNLVVSGCRW
jgi:hypothetical protein